MVLYIEDGGIRYASAGTIDLGDLNGSPWPAGTKYADGAAVASSTGAESPGTPAIRLYVVRDESPFDVAQVYALDDGSTVTVTSSVADNDGVFTMDNASDQRLTFTYPGKNPTQYVWGAASLAAYVSDLAAHLSAPSRK